MSYSVSRGADVHRATLRKNFSVLLYLVFTAFLVVGCGSSGGDFAFASGQTGGESEARDGVLETATFRVPTGETMTLTEDLTVFAREDIEISGNLLFNPGVNLTLIADGELVVSGKIGPTGVAGRQLASSDSSAPTPEVRAQTGTADGNFLILGSRTVRVAGTIEGTEGMDVFIANRNAGATTAIAIVTGTVTAGPGVPATSVSTPGDAGGTVHIGTPEALQLFEDRIRQSDSFRAGQFSAPSRLEITGNVQGGMGGEGFTDAVGTAGSERSRSFRGGQGGKGGDVRIGFRSETPQSTFLITRGSVMGGTGGLGGSCTGRGQDGLNRRERGGDVTVRTGNGGAGGDVTLLSDGPRRSDGIFVPGQPGQPGDSLVAAGNGGGAAGGGLALLTIGNFGAFGTTSGTSFQRSRPVPTVTVGLLNGGNGGTGIIVRPGGSGGGVGLELPPEFGRGFVGVGARLKLQVRNYGNGGIGLDGCGDAEILGTDGGESGAITTLINDIDGVPLGQTPDAIFIDSFNGANGGNDETSPGKGGAGLTAGQPDVISQVFLLTQNFETSFQNGVGGILCPEPPKLVFTVDTDRDEPGLQTTETFEFDPEDPVCGTLPTLVFEAGEDSVPLEYIVTPREPIGGSGINIDSTTGSLQPGQSVEMTPTFDCNTNSFVHTWDLRATGVTPEGAALAKDFVLVYDGTKAEMEPCVTQAMFINNSGFPADFQFFSSNMPVGINVLISGFPPNNVYLVEKDFQFDDLEVRFNSSVVPLGLVVPCGSRGVFTSSPGMITTKVEPIPAP